MGAAVPAAAAVVVVMAVVAVAVAEAVVVVVVVVVVAVAEVVVAEALIELIRGRCRESDVVASVARLFNTKAQGDWQQSNCGKK